MPGASVLTLSDSHSSCERLSALKARSTPAFADGVLPLAATPPTRACHIPVRVLSDCKDDARMAPPDSVANHVNRRSDIYDSNVLVLQPFTFYHKVAIELLVGSAEEVGVNHHMIIRVRDLTCVRDRYHPAIPYGDYLATRSLSEHRRPRSCRLPRI
jgi:hypothetical protein